MINNKKVIGILSKHVTNEKDSFEDYYMTGSSYVKKLDLDKVIPISLVLEKDLLNFDTLDLCDAFILPGGYWFEITTLYLIDYAIKNNKPILGICLGAQTIAIYSVIKDELKDKDILEYKDIVSICKKYEKDNFNTLLDFIPKPNYHNHDTVDKNCYHKIKIDKNSIAFEIFKKEELDVTSFHVHEIKKYGSDFKITAKAEDGVFEIIEYTKEPLVIGVQFHPELMDTNIFKYFIDRI